MRPIKQYHIWRDKETLEYLHGQRDLTYNEIKSIAGCSTQTVGKYIREFELNKGVRSGDRHHTQQDPLEQEWEGEGLRPRKQYRIWEDESTLEYLHGEKDLRYYEIASISGTGIEVVGQWVRHYGLGKGPRSGERHGNWKGGNIAHLYGDYWDEQSEKRREIDDYTCKRCGRTQEENFDRWDKKLSVHHRKDVREFIGENGEFDKYEAHDTDNLISLCVICHRNIESGIWELSD